MIEIKTTWAVCKAKIDAGRAFRYADLDNNYFIYVFEQSAVYSAKIFKGYHTAEQAEFESTYIPLAGRAIVSAHEPFAEATGFEVKAKGAKGTVTKNTTGNVDLKITEERHINGVEVILKNHVDNDTMKFQIVDVDNIFGLGAGTILKQFGEDWNVKTDTQGQGIISFPYRAKINAGLYVRLAYTSTGADSDVIVKYNLFLHKLVIT